MIQEAYCSFETAKLLKEKGFNEFCCAYYENYGTKQSLCIPIKRKGISNKDFNQRDNYNKRFNLPKENYKCTAPTQQMAMRWLREEYKLAINIRITCKKTISYVFEVWDFEIIHPNEFVGGTIDLREQQFDFKSYEEAVEAALKYVFENLI